MRTTNLSRRRCLAAAAAAMCPRRARGQAADPECRRCRGAGLVPLAAPKPFVFVEGVGGFRAAEAAAAEPCPVCQPMADKTEPLEWARQQHEGAVRRHKQWEDRTGWRLVLVQTRHAAIHTQHQPIEARRIGQAVEALTIHLQQATGSLELTRTQPDEYEQVLLLGQRSWDKFRTVLEGLYTPEQLGEPWLPARQLSSYDFYHVPHAFTTPERVRHQAPAYQAVKFAATRQIMLATGWKAPTWFCEGFGAYGQQAALGDVRISTVYAPERGPKAIYSLRDAREQTRQRQARPWGDLLDRELRDFEPADYAQALGMVSFLLDTWPAKFLSLVRLLKAGTPCAAAMEQAYDKDSTILSLEAEKWLSKA